MTVCLLTVSLFSTSKYNTLGGSITHGVAVRPRGVLHYQLHCFPLPDFLEQNPVSPLTRSVIKNSNNKYNV